MADWPEIDPASPLQFVINAPAGSSDAHSKREVIEAALKVPPTGPIGLEGDGGQMEYRRIRLKELP